MTSSPYKLLFVCLGNICRSPAAENIMNHLVDQAGLGDRIYCDSAGTCSYHIGNPPDRRMTLAASQRGLDMRGQARQLEQTDLQVFDLVLAMDRSNYNDILLLDPAGKYREKVRMMCSFCTQFSAEEVPDPYYGGPEGFNQVLDLLMDGCEGLLNHILRGVLAQQN